MLLLAAGTIHTRLALIFRARREASMSSNYPDIERFQSALVQSIRAHWVLFLVEGLVLVVLGLLAIALPPIASLAVAILVGWLILISGIVGLVTTFMMRHAPGRSEERRVG